MIILTFISLVTIVTLRIERSISCQSGKTKGRKDRKKAWEQVTDSKLPCQKKNQTVIILCTSLASHSAKVSNCSKIHHPVEIFRLLVRNFIRILGLSRVVRVN